jgi:DNA-binding NarL/FixJ family response regulator
MDTDAQLERELTEAQAAIASAREARLRRQEAVTRARAAGWSKYRIAQVLGVRGPTVDSILKSAERPDTAGE